MCEMLSERCKNAIRTPGTCDAIWICVQPRPAFESRVHVHLPDTLFSTTVPGNNYAELLREPFLLDQYSFKTCVSLFPCCLVQWESSNKFCGCVRQLGTRSKTELQGKLSIRRGACQARQPTRVPKTKLQIARIRPIPHSMHLGTIQTQFDFGAFYLFTLRKFPHLAKKGNFAGMM